MNIKIENYQYEKNAESAVSLLFDVQMEDGVIGTCNIWIQDIFHQLKFADGVGNKFLFRPKHTGEIHNDDVEKSIKNIEKNVHEEKFRIRIGEENTIKVKEEISTDVEIQYYDKLRYDVENNIKNIERNVHEQKFKIRIGEESAIKIKEEISADVEIQIDTKTYEASPKSLEQCNDFNRLKDLQTGNESSKQLHKNSIQEEVDKLIEYQECGESFTSTKLTLHKGKHKLKEYKCKKCGERFTQRGDLKSHQNKKHQKKIKKFKCQTCKKKFPCKYSFNVHVSIHTGLKPFECKECGKSFANNAYLSRHRKVHEGNKYKCEDCGKSYTTIAHLKTHKKTIHEDIKRFKCFKCSKCDKSYFRKGRFDAHMRAHSNIKPFECKECGKSFAWKRSLISHEKLHKGVTSFRCGECGEQFDRRHFLMLHSKEKHDHPGPFTCCECGKSFNKRTTLAKHFSEQH
eukprot:TCONS_00070725-protein